MDIYKCINIDIINILPLVDGVTVDYHTRVILFLLVVIDRNTLNQRQYVLYYTECPFFNNTLKHFSNITLKLMNYSDIN
jgi:hypothetical protein